MMNYQPKSLIVPQKKLETRMYMTILWTWLGWDPRVMD